jgi:AraC family transcriptional regulator of adaptative response/methylated-DNA-[protein]-cysteine methyltransferase
MPKPEAKVSDNQWLALSKRDRRHDGKFVYVARTTSIYCRPSCPARLPHRQNILVFATAREAEQHGYMACRRCHPHSLAPAERSIAAALDYIQAHLEQSITLLTLSQASGLSPNHLQRTFKRIVGLSPKEFCDAQRVVRFKQLLRQGESVSAAIYAVGYGSSRALYENAHKTLGMTPATYRRGAPGAMISYAIVDAKLGRVLLAFSEDGACAVMLAQSDTALVEELQREFPEAIVSYDAARTDRLQALARSCEREDPLLSNMRFELRCQLLHARLWRALRLQNAPARDRPVNARR